MNRYTVIGPGGEITAKHQHYNGRVDFDGRVVLGTPESRLHLVRWYIEVHEPRPLYADGYRDDPVIEGGKAIYKAIIPDEATRRQRALDELVIKLQYERDRRVAIATTGTAPDDEFDGGSSVQRKQMAAMMQSQTMARREYQGHATPDEIETLDMMSGIDGEVKSITLAQLALHQWASDHLGDWAEVDAFDPSNPPQEAPQWP